MNPEEIRKYCYFNYMRFGVAVSNLKKKYSDVTFTNQLQEVLALLVEISKNPSNYRHDKSDAYLYYFMEQNPSLNLGGNNPFCVLNISKAFSIDLIYLLVDECRNAGITDMLLRGNDLSKLTVECKVCVFDLFDDGKEEGFSPIKPRKK